jgi:hypothetical protein
VSFYKPQGVFSIHDLSCCANLTCTLYTMESHNMPLLNDVVVEGMGFQTFKVGMHLQVLESSLGLSHISNSPHLGSVFEHIMFWHCF